MTPTLRSRVRTWRDRLIARRRGPSPAAPRSPYRVPCPPPRAPLPSPLRASAQALRRLWTIERLRWIASAGALGSCAVGCFALLVRSARYAAPLVSPPVTHALALPFGVVVGLAAAVVFLAFGAAILALSTLILTSVGFVVTGLVRAAWRLVAALPGAFLAR
jgi:hypothetical protein